MSETKKFKKEWNDRCPAVFSRVPPSVKAALETLAKARGTTPAAVVRQFIFDGLGIKEDSDRTV
jgi:hypothetical protein